VSGSSDQGKQRTSGSGRPGESWERRASDLANDVQRWLIKSSARNMRDELGDQVKRAFRGQPNGAGDVWSTATTEPPDAASQPPECAWCPICRAARRMAQAQGHADAAVSPGDAAATVTAGLAGAADVLLGAARDAITGLDAILTYRPADGSSADRAAGASGSGAGSTVVAPPDQQSPTDPEREPDHEPDHRG
jgi:hypothetical protein